MQYFFYQKTVFLVSFLYISFSSDASENISTFVYTSLGFSILHLSDEDHLRQF